MELILDFKTWRAGAQSHENKIGSGITKLCNDAGFMCCLGQWALQCGFNKDEIMDVDEPAELSTEYGKIFQRFSKNNYYQRNDQFYNTELSNDCMEINDDHETTYQEKIRLLTERLAKEDIKLTVINLPS